MIYHELAPPPPLDQVVRCFWFLKSAATTGPPQPVVADGRLEIVLHAAEPFARLDSGGRRRGQEDALLAGQLTQAIWLEQRGAADVVGIRFRTGAARSVVPHSIAELNDQVTGLQRIDPALRDRLLRATRSSPDSAQRCAALSAVLLRAISTAPDPLVMTAVHELDRASPPRIDALANTFGVSLRTLERRIAQATGLAPRDLVRTMRFRRAFRLLQEAATGSMTSVAIEAGYFDQAHCIRDFRRFTGQSPREFFGQGPVLASAFLQGAE